MIDNGELAALRLHPLLAASKQMAYQVFANVVTAIEEQENREAKRLNMKKPERSEAFIPDQGFKTDEDVRTFILFLSYRTMA